jgi:acyl-coenzyme A thioesterase PaaI-like protein
MKHSLQDDNYCFVCGEANPFGLHLKFSLNAGKASAEFIPQKSHQGYKDIVHGGIISTILDEAMVKAALMQGLPAITGEIIVRFRNFLFAGEKTVVEAFIEKMNRKIIDASSVLKKIDNTIIAEGRAKLLKKNKIPLSILNV